MSIFSYPSVLTYVFGAQKNRLIETVIFEYPQHIFWLRNKNNIYFCYKLLTKGLLFIEHQVVINNTLLI